MLRKFQDCERSNRPVLYGSSPHSSPSSTRVASIILSVSCVPVSSRTNLFRTRTFLPGPPSSTRPPSSLSNSTRTCSGVFFLIDLMDDLPWRVVRGHGLAAIGNLFHGPIHFRRVQWRRIFGVLPTPEWRSSGGQAGGLVSGALALPDSDASPLYFLGLPESRTGRIRTLHETFRVCRKL